MLLNEEELAAWRGMLRAHAELTKELDAELAREHDLRCPPTRCCSSSPTPPDGRMRMSELADSVLLSRSGLTRLVDRLEREGLLKRERCESDARGFFAEITPRAGALFDAARRTHLDGVRAALPRPLLARRAAHARRRSGRRSRHRGASRTSARPRRARARRRTSRMARASRRTPSSSSAGSSSENDSRNDVWRAPLGRDRAAGRERHAVARRLGVERALVERAR